MQLRKLAFQLYQLHQPARILAGAEVFLFLDKSGLSVDGGIFVDDDLANGYLGFTLGRNGDVPGNLERCPGLVKHGVHLVMQSL